MSWLKTINNAIHTADVSEFTLDVSDLEGIAAELYHYKTQYENTLCKLTSAQEEADRLRSKLLVHTRIKQEALKAYKL